jgi:hypothetical protein
MLPIRIVHPKVIKHKVILFPGITGLNLIEVVVNKVRTSPGNKLAIQVFTLPIGTDGRKIPPSHVSFIPCNGETQQQYTYEKFDQAHAIEYLEKWERLLAAQKSKIVNSKKAAGNGKN